MQKIKFKNCKNNVSIDNLYNSRVIENPHKMMAVFKNSEFVYEVILAGRDKTPDCSVSSFSANLFFRTYNGVNRKKYKTITAVARAVKNRAKQIGMELDYLEIMPGEPGIF